MQFKEGYPFPTEGYKLENQVGNEIFGCRIILEVPLVLYGVRKDELKSFIDYYNWKTTGNSEKGIRSIWPFRRKITERSRTYNLTEGKIYVKIHDPSHLKNAVLANVNNPNLSLLEELINPLIEPLEKIQKEIETRKSESFRRLDFALQMR